MSGVRVAALYSYGCNKLKELGAEKIIFEFVKNPEDSKTLNVIKILKETEAYVFYEFIAVKNNLEPFDLEVVRSYWGVGIESVELLEKIKIQKQDLQEFLLKIPSKDPRIWKIFELHGGLATHNFSVLSILKKIKQLTENLKKELNDCLIRAGKVIEIKDSKILVETERINFEDFSFSKAREEIERSFLENVKTGEFVSIHFDEAREIISLNEAKMLKLITQKALSFLKR